MTHNKHPKGKRPSDMDLANNPGIGTSKGTIREGDDLLLRGANTFEGDVENDVTYGGGIAENRQMRDRRHPRTSGPRHMGRVGKKTHDQQIQVIEGRVNTKNAGKDFDAEIDLQRSEKEREAFRKGANLNAPRNLSDPDDRNMLRGEHQESRHHKNRPDD
jgi:hypothetical protein